MEVICALGVVLVITGFLYRLVRPRRRASPVGRPQRAHNGDESPLLGTRRDELAGAADFLIHPDDESYPDAGRDPEGF